MENKLKKIILFISVFIFILILQTPLVNANNTQFAPQVTMGDFEKGKTYDIGPTSIGEYIREIYSYAIGVVGIIACIVLMFGGFRWLTAGGSPDKVQDAKEWIKASLTGLILTLASYMILATVNPKLVTIQSIAPDSPAADSSRNKQCCSKLKGPTGPFLISRNSQQEYTCSVPDDKKAEFGNTVELTSRQECYKQGSSYVIRQCGWVALGSTAGMADYKKVGGHFVHKTTNEPGCSRVSKVPGNCTGYVRSTSSAQYDCCCTITNL